MTASPVTQDNESEVQSPEGRNADNDVIEDMEDSVARLFKKFLWNLVPDEFYQEGSNRPVSEVRDIYYTAIDQSTSRLVKEFLSESEELITKLQQADRMTDLKKRLDAAFQDGDLDTLEEIASVLEGKAE